MTPDRNGGIDGEVVRIEAVRYLQGSIGHATASLLAILLGGFALATGYTGPGVLLMVGAVVLSLNGLSIWGWDRLQEYFAARTRPEESGPGRPLQARPFSTETIVELKAGAVMVLSFVGFLLVGDLARRLLDLQTVGVVCVGLLAAGNVAALVRTYHRSKRR